MKTNNLNKKVISLPISMKLAILPYIYCKTTNFAEARLDDSNTKVQVKEWVITDTRLIDTFGSADNFIKEFNKFSWEVVFHTTEGIVSWNDLPASIATEAKNGTINAFFHQGTWIGRFSYKKLSLNNLSFNSTKWAESVLNDSKKMWFIHLITNFANIEVEFPNSYIALAEFLNEITTKQYSYSKDANGNLVEKVTVEITYDDLDKPVSKLTKESTKIVKVDGVDKIEEEIKIRKGLAHPDILCLLVNPTDYTDEESKHLFENFEASLNNYLKDLSTYSNREMDVISNNAENEILTNMYLKCIKSNNHKLAKNNLSCCSRRHVPFYTSLDREESAFCVNKVTTELNADFQKSVYILGYKYAISIAHLITYEESYKLSINNHTIRLSATEYGTVDNDGESISYLDDKSGTVAGFSNVNFQDIFKYWKMTEVGRSLIQINGTSNLLYTCDLGFETIIVNKLKFSRSSFIDYVNESTYMGRYNIIADVPRIHIPLIDLRTDCDEFTYDREIGGTLNPEEYKHEYISLNAYESDQAEKMIKQPIEVMLPMFTSTIFSQLVRQIHLTDLHIPLFTSDVLFPSMDDLEEVVTGKDASGVPIKTIRYESFIDLGRLKQTAKADELKYNLIKPVDLIKIKMTNGYFISNFSTLAIKLGVDAPKLMSFINTIITTSIFVFIERQNGMTYCGSKVFMKKLNKRIVALRNRMFSLNSNNIENNTKISVETPASRDVVIKKEENKVSEIANSMDVIKNENTIVHDTENTKIPTAKEIDNKDRKGVKANVTELGTDAELEGNDIA